MLKYFYDNDLVRIYDKTPDNWEDAVRLSCENFLEKGIVGPKYVEEIVECVKKYGPYIVLIPGVAMPHSSEDSEGVFGTGISFAKIPENVSFEEGNPEKDAKLFFTLAAKNGEEHMQNIANLSEMLMEDGLVEALCEVNNMDDYKAVMEQFNI